MLHRALSAARATRSPRCAAALPKAVRAQCTGAGAAGRESRGRTHSGARCPREGGTYRRTLAKQPDHATHHASHSPTPSAPSPHNTRKQTARRHTPTRTPSRNLHNMQADDCTGGSALVAVHMHACRERTECMRDPHVSTRSRTPRGSAPWATRCCAGCAPARGPRGRCPTSPRRCEAAPPTPSARSLHRAGAQQGSAHSWRACRPAQGGQLGEVSWSRSKARPGGGGGAMPTVGACRWHIGPGCYRIATRKVVVNGRFVVFKMKWPQVEGRGGAEADACRAVRTDDMGTLVLSGGNREGSLTQQLRSSDHRQTYPAAPGRAVRVVELVAHRCGGTR